MNCAKSCLFCLANVDPATCSEIVTKNPKNVEIQPLLHYLTGVNPSSAGESPGSRIPVITQLPPLCLPCYEKLGKLHQLHQNLLEIQRLIQNLTLEIRNSMRQCRIAVDGKTKSKLDTFQDDKVGKVSESQGQRVSSSSNQRPCSNDVIFPSGWIPAPSSEASAPTAETDGDSLMTFNEQQEISMEVDPLIDSDTDVKPDDSIKEEQEHPEPIDDNYSAEGEILSDGDEDWEPEFAKKADSSKKKVRVESKKKVKRLKNRDSTEAFVCRFCNKTYVTYERRSSHYRYKHAEQYAAELQRQKALKSFPYSLSSKPDNVAAQICSMCITKRKVIWVELSKMGLHMEAHLGDGRQGWKCQVCHEIFPTRSMILYHIEKNSDCSKSNSNDFMKHICTLCQPQKNEFQTEMDLFNHLFDVHEKDESLEKLHQCKCCDSKYRTELGLDFHVNRHVTKVQWRKRFHAGRVPCPKDENLLQKCKVCDKMIPSVEMKIHLTTEHNDRIEEFVFIKCKLCSEELIDCGDREEYQKHIQSCHNQPNIQKPCDICESEVFDRMSELRKHYFHIHQIGTQFNCEQCSATLYTQLYLKLHIQKNHSETEGKFPCEFCLKSGDTSHAYLASKLSLEQHLANVHPVDRYKCERLQCTAQFRCKADFMEHEKNDHQDDPLKCTDPFCSKEFVHAIQLKSHVEKTHEGKGWPRKGVIMKCSVCDKAFRCISHLKLHEKIHSEEKPFQCDQCPKLFKCEHQFKKHQLIHLPGGRPRPFMCDVCSRAFFDTKSLEQHARIHTGERPFPCQFCGMAFRQKTSLRTHEQGHKNKKENFRSRGTFERGAKRN